MDYVICEYGKVKKEFPEFRSVMENLQNELINLAQQSWPSMKYGGIYPKAGEFGKTTIMPELFINMSGVTLTTWLQNLTALGHQTIMAGSQAGGTIAEDYKIGLVGLAFLDKAIRISEIKMQISDKKLPRINIEECMAYEQPAIVFEDGFILDEEHGFDLYAYVLSQGYQRIKLIGLQLNRVPNKLQVSNTGAAIT